MDDDHFANTLVQFVLSKEGYEVEVVDNPRGAMHLIQQREPDLLLLDVGLPHTNGFALSAQLRNQGYEIPLIFMTALDTEEAILQGFEHGAEDYLCKPYDHQELVARVQAVLRRVKQQEREALRIVVGPFELFPAELSVAVAGRMIPLTPTEMNILRILMSNPGQVITRDQLLAEVWNDRNPQSNLVDVYVRRLRAKVEADPDHPRHLLSVHGRGYQFRG